MANRTVTVKSSGGDYTSLNAALSGESTNLVTNTRILTIECYAFNDTTRAAYGNGYTESASYYVKITVPASERHLGYWDASKYVLSSTSTADGNVLDISYNYCLRVEWVQVWINISAYSGGTIGGFGTRNDGAEDFRLENCIVKCNSGITGTGWIEGFSFFNFTAYGSCFIINCIAFGFGQRSFTEAFDLANSSSGNILYVYNCVGSRAYHNFYSNETSSPYVVFKNCLSHDPYSLDFLIDSTTNANSTNNAADGTTSVGSNQRTSQIFSFVDAANGDFRLTRADTGARRYGANLYNDAAFPFQTDIEGKDRGGSGATWDIGASMLDFVQVVAVKSSNGDYTSLNAALSGESKSLTSSMYQLNIETYAFEDTTDADTGTGYTTDSSYYIKITSPTSERHAGVWNAAKSRHKSTSSSTTNMVIAINNQENYTIIEWQQVDSATTGNCITQGTIGINSQGCYGGIIRNCITRRTSAPSNSGWTIGIQIYDSTSGTYSEVYRNVVYGFGSTSSDGDCGIMLDSIRGYAFNNTVFECKNAIFIDNFINDLPCTIKNNFMGSCSGDCYIDSITAAVTTAKNITSDATSPDGASYQGKTSYSSYFLDYANKDFRLLGSTGAANVLFRTGNDLGATYKTSIADDYYMIDPAPTGYGGYVMTGTLWDIGAIQCPNHVQTSIKSTGGQFTTLNAALSAISQNLVTTQVQVDFLTYAFEDTTDADTGTGYTTDATYFIKITSPASERHAGVWNAAKSRHKSTSNSPDRVAAIKIQESYTIVEWQQVESNPSSGSIYEIEGIYVFECGNCSIRNNIVKREGSSVVSYQTGVYVESSSATYTNYIYRNIIYGYVLNSIDRGITVYPGTGTNYIYNNTAFGNGTGIYVEAGSVYIKNNFSGSNGNKDYEFGVGVSSAKNISSDATSPDGASYQGKTSYSSYFNDYTNKNFHLKSTDTVLKNTGDNLGSPYDIDIDGVAVTGSWDIGADEYVAGTDPTIDQEGFRFRNDNGTEVTATWITGQDINVMLLGNVAFRLRELLNATLDPDSINAQIEFRYKPVGGSFGSWTKVN